MVDRTEGGCLLCFCEKEVGGGQGRGGGCLLCSCEKEVGGGQGRGGMSIVLFWEGSG